MKIAGLSVLHLADDGTEVREEQVFRSHIVLDPQAELIAEGHLAQCCCEALRVNRVSTQDPPCLHIFKECTVLSLRILKVRYIILISVDLYQDQLAAGLLEFRTDDIADRIHVYGKGYQCRRYIDLIERSAHGILAADGRKAKPHLCRISSQKSCRRLAPTLRILAHPAEILLEGKADL